MNARQALGISTLALAALAISGCSAGDPEPEPSGFALPKVSITSQEDVVAKLDFAHGIANTPLDRISLDEPAFSMKQFHAVAVRTDECMVERGLEPVASKTNWSPYLDFEDRRWGGWSVDYASEYGVDAPPNAGPQFFDTLPLGVEYNKAFAQCDESAKDSLKTVFAFTEGAPQIDYRIRTGSSNLAENAPAGRKALASWHACEEKAGIVLDPQDGYPSAQYKAQGKEAEIHAAVVQAQCAVDTGAVQTLYDLQAKYEAAYLDQQATAVQAFVKKRKAVEKHLDAVIAGR
ncbi:hypothetical protein [Frondihabitans cladoniiphilus]|uniref:Uncharacterized protein n=1 Tax=Frondihabitans cladoniiphilus TaxID=715785 RepID=A0ABP8W2V7_9MICO